MLAFVHIHKTGGTTVNYILRSSFGTRHCEPEPWSSLPPHLMRWQVPISASDLQRLRKLYPHPESIGEHYVQPHSDLDTICSTIKYFTFVREPLRMRASMFQHGVRNLGEKNITFEDWLQEEQSRNRCTKMIAGTDDVEKAIRVIQDKGMFVGLTERFDESMLLLRNLIANNLNIMYKRLRVARDNSVAQSLLSSARAREMLAEGNEQDIALYNYVKKELYPVYQREYGDSLEEDVAQYRASLRPYHGVESPFFEKSQIYRLALLGDLAPFDRRNVMLSVLKKNLVYRPALYLYRTSEQVCVS